MRGSASYLETLAAAADNTSTVETGYRREAAERIKALAQERAFAFRRLNLMRAVAQAVTAAESEEAAVACAHAVLRARLGWAGDNETHSAILSRFDPVAAALFAGRLSDGEASGPDIAGALAEFETWYAAARAAPFWALFEQHVAETPVVDF